MENIDDVLTDIKGWIASDFYELKTDNNNFYLINEYHIFSKQKQIEKIDLDINKYSNLLNKVYPFVSYHFVNKIFNEDEFIENTANDLISFIIRDENFYDTYRQIEEDKRAEIISERFYEFVNMDSIDFEDNVFIVYYKENYLIKYQQAKLLEALLLKKDSLMNDKVDFSNDKNELPLVDFSNSKLTEKIIALNEAGILDFLKEKQPFNLSTNSLAEFLSLCLGEKTTSIQSYINPIINNSDQSKSPYYTAKTVEKVKLKLIQIGLKIE